METALLLVSVPSLHLSLLLQLLQPCDTERNWLGQVHVSASSLFLFLCRQYDRNNNEGQMDAVF